MGWNPIKAVSNAVKNTVHAVGGVASNVADAVGDTVHNVSDAVSDTAMDAAPYIGAVLPVAGVIGYGAQKSGLNNGGGLLGGMSSGFSTALPYYAAAGATALTAGAVAPMFGTSIPGLMATGAAAGTAGGATTNVANGDPIYQNALQNATIGAITGGTVGYAMPAGSAGLQNYAGMSERLANTTAGAGIGAATNATTQYITTGEVNPMGVGMAGIMGGAGGYKLDTMADLPGSAGDSPMYSDENFAPISGTGADGLEYTYSDGSYTQPQGDYNTAGFKTMATIPDADIAASFNAGPGYKMPYDKLIKAGLLFATPDQSITPWTNMPVNTFSPTFASLNTQQAKQAAQTPESQALFDWQKQAALQESTLTKDYLKDAEIKPWQADDTAKPETGQQDTEKKRYLSDYISRDKQPLSWQQYA